MADPDSIGIVMAFGAGVISFLSPCVLPLVPAYVSYLAGEGVQRKAVLDAKDRLHALGMSVPFVAGFSAVFVAFGASASALGQLLQRYRFEANLAAGVVIIGFGLFMLGLWRWMPMFNRDLRPQLQLAGSSPLGAFALGTAFAFGWTPCIGPILGSVLALSAVSTSDGIGLLGAYSFGLGLPFLATALFVDRAVRVLRALRGVGAALRIVGGAVLVVLGIAMITGQMAVFSLWLLDTFPALGGIG